MNKGNNPGKIIAEEAYQYLHWVTGIVVKFPKAYKFQIGDRIQDRSLDLLMLIVEATYNRDRAPLLRRAQIFLEQLRFLFRLSHDARLINEGGYEHAARQLDRIGRSLGGWQKAHNAQATRPPVRDVRELPGVAPRGETGDPG
jgi:hypothetical protein